MAFEISLAGKVCLVTGGARGIGAEICRKMAKAGASIVVNYYHSDADRNAAAALSEELCAAGTKVLLCECDISKEDEVIAMMASVKETFGALNIVVNNAGILMTRTFETMTFAEWRAINGVIMDGAFLVSKYALPMMSAGSSFVMISSNVAINGGGGSPAYPAAKAGLEGIARQIVIDHAANGIRANIIQPAVIDTDMFRQRYPTDEDVANYGKRMPVGRVGTPADIANAAVVLASDEASYICGVTLQVDGGRTYYAKMK